MVQPSNKARSRRRASQPTIPDPHTAELRAALVKYYLAAGAPVKAPDGMQQVVSSAQTGAAQHLLGMPGFADTSTAVAEALKQQSLWPKQLRLRRTLCNVLREDLLFDVGPVVGSQRQIKLNVQTLLSAASVIGPAAGPASAQTLMPTVSRASPTSRHTSPAEAMAVPADHPADATEQQEKQKQKQKKRHRQQKQTDTPDCQIDQSHRKVEQQTRNTPAKRRKTGHGVDATEGPRAAAAGAEAAAAARAGPTVHGDRNGAPAVTAAGQAAAADASTPTAGPLQLLPPPAQAALAAAAVPRSLPTPHGQQQHTGHEPAVSSCHRCQKMKMITSMFKFGAAMAKAGAASDTVLHLMPLEFLFKEAKQLATSTSLNA